MKNSIGKIIIGLVALGIASSVVLSGCCISIPADDEKSSENAAENNDVSKSTSVIYEDNDISQNDSGAEESHDDVSDQTSQETVSPGEKLLNEAEGLLNDGDLRRAIVLLRESRGYDPERIEKREKEYLDRFVFSVSVSSEKLDAKYTFNYSNSAFDEEIIEYAIAISDSRTGKSQTVAKIVAPYMENASDIEILCSNGSKVMVAVWFGYGDGNTLVYDYCENSMVQLDSFAELKYETDNYVILAPAVMSLDAFDFAVIDWEGEIILQQKTYALFIDDNKIYYCTEDANEKYPFIILLNSMNHDGTDKIRLCSVNCYDQNAEIYPYFQNGSFGIQGDVPDEFRSLIPLDSPYDIYIEKPVEEVKILTVDEAKAIAEDYWSYDTFEQEYGMTASVNIDNNKTTTVNGVTYYFFRFSVLVDNHFTTWDTVYVNSVTGECTYDLP